MWVIGDRQAAGGIGRNTSGQEGWIWGLLGAVVSLSYIWSDQAVSGHNFNYLVLL